MPELTPAKDGEAADAHEEDGEGAGAGYGAGKQSRAEKKARRTVIKQGAKAVPGVARVTIKKPKNTLFVINNPDVFKSPNADTYIVFGQAVVENTAGADMAQAAKAFEAGGMDEALAQAGVTPPAVADAATTGDGDAPAAGGDEDGVASTDIDLVVSQTNVSRDAAIAALKKNKGDIVKDRKSVV